MKSLGSILFLSLLSAPAAPQQTSAPPVHQVRRRRPPAPDPEKEALRRKLAEATASASALDSRVIDLLAENASLRQRLDADAAATASLQQKVDAANQSAAALQTRLTAAEERANRLTAEKEKLQAAPPPPAQRQPPPEETRLQAQLDDIHRRRDAYISSILRRYRELANEYRSFGTACIGPNDVAAKSGPELTRIQNTIAMVEEDLRQVNGLEAQAALVRKSQAKIKKP